MAESIDTIYVSPFRTFPLDADGLKTSDFSLSKFNDKID
jgi:hypothetical protein